MSREEKKEVVYFHCETELRNEFYKMAQDKNISPAILLRAFMRKAVKTWKEEASSGTKKDKKE